jgi:uncharacterized protein GlcG (DUF336 family)
MLLLLPPATNESSFLQEHPEPRLSRTKIFSVIHDAMRVVNLHPYQFSIAIVETDGTVTGNAL